MTPETQALLEELRDAIRGVASPWLKRGEAAEYARCDVGEIDRLAAQGRLTRRYFNNSPRYRKDEIDALMKGRKNRKAME